MAHAPWKFGGETPVVCVGEMDICHGDILPGDTTYDLMGYWYSWNMGFNKMKKGEFELNHSPKVRKKCI